MLEEKEKTTNIIVFFLFDLNRLKDKRREKFSRAKFLMFTFNLLSKEEIDSLKRLLSLFYFF